MTDPSNPAAAVVTKDGGSWLRALWSRLVEPPESIRGPGERRSARLLSSMLIGLLLLTLIGAIPVSLPLSSFGISLPMWFTVLAVLAAYVLGHAGHYRLSVGITVAALTLLPFGMVLVRADRAAGAATAFTWVPLTLLISSVFVPVSGTALLALVHVAGLLALVAIVPEITLGTIGTPLGLILPTSILIMIATRHRNLVERDRQAELAAANRELRVIRASLEQRVAERTHVLERRAQYLVTTAEIAQDAAAVLDLPVLLSRTVALIGERFGFYHAGIFMLDQAREWAVLQAASSEGGRRMLARQHRLRVGEEGIVGFVTGRGEPRIALDVGQDAVFFDNPDLPETRSEMALPLRVQGTVIGALDVQSREPQAFLDEDVSVLQTLADQTALAIHTSRLFEQLQATVELERRAYGEASREAWMDILRQQPNVGFVKERGVLSRSSEPLSPQARAVLRSGRPLSLNGEERSLLVPIKVRDHVVGVVDARKPSKSAGWTEEQMALLETVIEELGQALESAQLYRDAQRRAAREQLTREVTDKLRRAVDMEALLQTAIRETASVLGASRAFVQWLPDDGIEPPGGAVSG